MEFPFGHHHHHRRDDDDYESGGSYPRPPPQFSNSPFPPPSHQPSYGSSNHPYPPPGTYPPPPDRYPSSDSYPPPPDRYPSSDSYPPPPSFGGAYHHAPPPPPPHVSYAPPPPSHEEIGGSGHHFKPHMPSFIHSHFHGGGGGESKTPETLDVTEGGPNLGELANKPTYKIYCKAGGDRYSVGIRDGKVVLTHHDFNDPTQHWYKDERYSTRVKDEDGYPSFQLVNKGTGQALKHNIANHPVQLCNYEPNAFDGTVLWTESKDLGGGFRTVRMVNNVRLGLDAFHGDKEHGGVRDGTIVALYELWKGDNQQWKIVRY